MSMQQGQVAGMQHGMLSGHAAWTCGIDIQHGLAARTCSMDMQHAHAAWTCSKDMKQGHAAGTCSMDMRLGYALRYSCMVLMDYLQQEKKIFVFCCFSSNQEQD
jgi:hypothetical protein